ncbi:WGR domain-containing protein [Anabaena sp. UHCC 0399]|uniref:WGR domain-containing protein n=1 Tax=Anabaena sp. UHCC 0399 TaxID=3110238 RepID=UPI002B20A558|nr:WGR domain-containing protein [Anabaena sp. UHCC 0399]MEA5567796.1 WGR domain-containing protein [Anabaena sp. UHCC 0399]
MEIYLVFVDALRNSNKFWSAKVEGNQLTVEWGRVGYNSQQKIHSLSTPQKAIYKYQTLVAEKKNKGYQESQPQIDSRNISEIRRAIQLLDLLRPYVANRNFNAGYIQLINDYLKIVPTPLGMQIDPCRVYRSVEDVDHQRELLSSLLVAVPQTTVMDKSEPKTVSLKSISKNFWRHF